MIAPRRRAALPKVALCARGATVAAPTSVAAWSASVCGRAVAFLRLADLEGPASEVRSVQRLRGARRIFMRHLHTTEAAGSTGVPTVDRGEPFYDSVRLEQGAHGILGGCEGKISNV